MSSYDNKVLYTSLLELDVIAKAKLDEALLFSEKENRALGEVLVDRNLITEENLGKILGDILGFPFAVLQNHSINDQELAVIPEEVAREQNAIVFEMDGENIDLATTNVDNNRFFDFLEKKSGKNVRVHLAGGSDLSRALDLYSADVAKAFEEIIKENVHEAGARDSKDLPIIQIVDTLIGFAYQNNASDIHIEPTETISLVRFRVDGVLKDVVELPLDIHPRVVSRIKVLASLRTDEHSAAQDGKIRHDVHGEGLDIRVSIVPVTNGEKVVMRLLSERSRNFSLEGLGFSEEDMEKVEKAYKKPHGMILATGPTGSGKTTSLYAIMKILNRRSVNVMTIEDPVEYDMEHVNQIQVNEKTGLTFARGLRSIVRQDPDIVLVGEIRDEETADIAVNAAMTGHLVLSSIHTNDAATTFPRLLDLKVEPYLVASTVNIVVAQRLVRKIHKRCRASVEIDTKTLVGSFSPALLKKFFPKKGKVRVYKGKGCDVCYGTGYYGRIGVFEVLFVDDEVREAISNKKNASDIQKIAIKNGMTTMMEDGLLKVTQGDTTIEEVLRVTKE